MVCGNSEHLPDKAKNVNWAAADLPTALARVSFTWLVSQPVAAAQLVLVTAAEGRSLVGATNFASVLPLAATGKCPLCCWHVPSTAALLLCCAGRFLSGFLCGRVMQ